LFLIATYSEKLKITGKVCASEQGPGSYFFYMIPASHAPNLHQLSYESWDCDTLGVNMAS